MSNACTSCDDTQALLVRMRLESISATNLVPLNGGSMNSNHSKFWLTFNISAEIDVFDVSFSENDLPRYFRNLSLCNTRMAIGKRRLSKNIFWVEFLHIFSPFPSSEVQHWRMGGQALKKTYFFWLWIWNAPRFVQRFYAWTAPRSSAMVHSKLILLASKASLCSNSRLGSCST